MKARTYVASAFLLASIPCGVFATPTLQDGGRDQGAVHSLTPPPPRLHNLTPLEEQVADRAEDSTDTWNVAGRSFGVHVSGEEVWGLGPTYKVRFADGAFEFTPALGREAPRNFPLSFRLDSIWRGGELVHRPGGPATAFATVREVSYTRGVSIVERYDVRADGIEQSFVFEDLPAGTGELIVRGRIESELRASIVGATSVGLSFESDGFGGVRFGAVVGIDADGRTVTGELRFSDGWLDLVLPADFVDSAALPLVLDPIIGSTFDVSSSFDDNDADVAYDRSSNSYLVVWERQFSAVDVDVRGQRVGTDGTLLGSILSIETSISMLSANPTVAGSNTTNSYLVAWQEGPSLFGPWNIRGRAVDASSGALSDILTITSTSGDEVDPDAGGDSQYGDDDVLVVWTDVGGGIDGAQVSLPLTGDPFLVNTFTVSSNGNDSKPAISKSGGAAGRYLVAWQRYYSSPFPGDHEVFGRVVDRNGNLLTFGTLLVETIGPNEEEVDVDGDGDNWVVAYESQEGLGSGDMDIHCLLAEYTGSSLDAVMPPVSVEADAEEEIHPAVAFADEKYFVAWCDQDSGLDYDIWAVGLNPKDCSICETEFLLGGGTGFGNRVELASRESGQPGGGDQLLAVWEQNDLSQPFETTIKARRFEAIGTKTKVKNIGGGCGNGGFISFIGLPAPGNANFKVAIAGADPGAVVAILNVTDSPVQIDCGLCTVNEFHFTLSTLLNGGAGSISLPIPCKPNYVGKTFEFQWTVGPTKSTPCFLAKGVSFTDRLAALVGY